jgi:uncharacterized protein YjbI with pentapeptide repeats
VDYSDHDRDLIRCYVNESANLDSAGIDIADIDSANFGSADVDSADIDSLLKFYNIANLSLVNLTSPQSVVLSLT